MDTRINQTAESAIYGPTESLNCTSLKSQRYIQWIKVPFDEEVCFVQNERTAFGRSVVPTGPHRQDSQGCSLGRL
ncbi:hypothetical protein HHI36_001773, partial [Cryptolaemus montrouzieri]